MSTDPRSRAWVEVSASALRQNLLTVRDTVGEEVRLIPMVKANAYGIGVEETVAALGPLDPWGFGVAAVEEGVGLRELGTEGPILVCSPVPPDAYEAAVDSSLILSISDLEGLARLKGAAVRLRRRGRFHLEVDTGMGRAGLDWRSLEAWAPALEAALGPELSWEGIFTHFHSADSAEPGPTRAQWDRLQGVVARLGGTAGSRMVHACNSPGALRRPDFAADAVRPGIFLYGGRAGESLPQPAPVASLKARIVLIKEATEGSTLGYGATHVARRQERWGTVSIGYGDGLPRLLGNRGEAVVQGVRAPIIGRISMDVTVLDITEIPGVEVGDVVTFFGAGIGAGITVDEVAEHAQTISYEILTGLTQRLPRIWMDDGGY